MGDDLAAANVNRSYSLAATSIAIFAFMLFFLCPKVACARTVSQRLASRHLQPAGRRDQGVLSWARRP